MIYLDENLSSVKIGSVLRQFRSDWVVELHFDHFPPQMSDVDVITECGARDWIFISCDDRIRYVARNKAAIIGNRVKAFMFPKGNYHGADYSAALSIARRNILRLSRKTAGPFFARLHINGDVRLIEEKAKTELTARERTARKYGAAALQEDDDEDEAAIADVV